MEQERLKAGEAAAQLVNKESSSSLGSLSEHEFIFFHKPKAFIVLHDASSKGSNVDQLQTLPMEPEPVQTGLPVEEVPKEPLHGPAEMQVEKVTEPVLAKGVPVAPESSAEAEQKQPLTFPAQPPCPEKIPELAVAEEQLKEEATATAAEADALRRQQLQMRNEEKDKAEAARQAKKEAKEQEPKAKAKGKAKGRPRKTVEDDKENKSAGSKKRKVEEVEAPKEPVLSTPSKRKGSAADGEEKVKKTRAKAAKKQKVGGGNMEVDEELVSEFLAMMHKFDGCVYDKSFDALYTHFDLNWKLRPFLIFLYMHKIYISQGRARALWKCPSTGTVELLG